MIIVEAKAHRKKKSKKKFKVSQNVEVKSFVVDFLIIGVYVY